MNVFDVLREKLEEGENKRLQLAGETRYDIQLQLAGCYSHAIEIVNQVEQEYNNDFCEWKPNFERRTYTGYYFCNCDDEMLFTKVEVESFNVCPYCGKKIKVIEPKEK